MVWLLFSLWGHLAWRSLDSQEVWIMLVEHGSTRNKLTGAIESGWMYIFHPRMEIGGSFYFCYFTLVNRTHSTVCTCLLLFFFRIEECSSSLSFLMLSVSSVKPDSSYYKKSRCWNSSFLWSVSQTVPSWIPELRDLCRGSLRKHLEFVLSECVTLLVMLFTNNC